MNGKDCRDKSARPKAGCHLLKHEKQQNNRNRVQQQIDEMMAAGLEAEQLAIEHVRERGERVPVARMRVGERPGNVTERKASAYGRVVSDINWIIEINEVVAKRLREDEPGNRNETNADNDTG
jgi:uncharacterized protein YoaH (UPF0181 family)